MPEAIAAPPPSMSPATAPPAQSGSAPPSSGNIVLDKPIDPTPPPKPGSVRESIFKNLRAKAATETPPAKPETKEVKKETPKPEAQQPQPKTETVTEGQQPAEAVKPADPKPDKTGKASPWKLVDQFKQRTVEAETKLAELQKLFPDAKSAEATKAHYESIAKRNEELESEIRYVSYTKSKEFQDQYQKPYEDAWKRAMSNLGEIPVDTGNGQVRALNAEDILQLVNLPLTQADELAEQKFGRYAKHVMDERKEIRKLWDAQAQALENAKKTAGEREQQLKQQWQQNGEALRAEVTKLWADSNKAVEEHPEFGKYFKAPEGDEESKASLQKGYELVDGALSVNALDPRLTPEQRATAVKKQAVIRHRAAAFGNLTRQLKTASARIAELEKDLAQYKESEPGTDGRKSAATPAPMSTRESVMQAFRSKAR